jgi:hypothetical protein
MIRFDLYISPNFRGGQHYTYFDAKDYKDLVSWLKHHWRRTGFHSSSGEIFVHATVKVGGKSQQVNCGYYVFDSDGAFSPLSSKDAEDEIVEFWESLDINFDKTGDEELFEVKVTKLFRKVKSENKANLPINSPENVLGTWLLKLVQMHGPDFYSFGEVQAGFMTAAVLNLAKTHKKTFQMFAWLVGENGKEFLNREPYQPIGSRISIELERIMNMHNSKPTEADLNKYIDSNFIPSELQPKLIA